jgi:phospholipid-binding lipoprotein MlaA
MSRKPAAPAPLAALLFLLLLAGAPASGQEATTQEETAQQATSQEVAALTSDTDQGAAGTDPWEGMNRGIFTFNETLDRWILEPVATGWDFVMPDPVERAIVRFFANARFPVVFVNDLLQAKPLAAAQDLGRFALNTTAGIGGLFDPASQVAWLPAHDEDFGQTLGFWGVPPGPYLVLPVLGPSNPRDTGGLVVDSVTLVYPYFLPFYVNAASTAVNLVNRRSRLLETIREERAAAFDFYAAARNAYVQHRENVIADRAPEPEESDDDLYNLDYGEDVE